MKIIRGCSIVLFLVSLVVYGGYRMQQIKEIDYIGPQILMDKTTVKVQSSAGEVEMLQGVTAEDAKDGDVTDSLIVESMTNFLKKGRRQITLAAFDGDGHVTKAVREVVYTDYHSPRFQLSEPLSFPLYTTDIQENLTAEDILDGDLTTFIKIPEEYHFSADREGEYPMEFTVSNSAGDVARLPATIRIYDPGEELNRPKITLSESLIYVEGKKPVNPWSYVKRITLDGRTYERTTGDADGPLEAVNPYPNQEKTEISAEEVQMTGKVSYKKPGTYELTYRIADEDDNWGVTRLLVVVTE